MKYILLAIALTGCASTPPATKVETIEVKVPVAVKCQTPEPTPPVLVSPTLKKEDDIYTKVKAVLADIETYKAYAIELSASLKSCK